MIVKSLNHVLFNMNTLALDEVILFESKVTVSSDEEFKIIVICEVD